MQYKALFLDVDDTLIGKDRIISKGNLEAIKRAQQAGALITIATGRGYLACSMIWRELNIQGPVITYGGAMIMDTKNDSCLFSADIPPALIREALEISREWDVIVQIYQGDTVITELDNSFTQNYVAGLKLPHLLDPDIRDKEWKSVPKVLAYVPPEQEVEMVARFRDRFSGRLEVASSRPGFIELNQYGANKGTTMLHLGELLGIKREEIIAVGDNTLDLDMIKMAGLGVCVDNGQQVVKDVADVIAPSCDEDGVKWVIEKYLLN